MSIMHGRTPLGVACGAEVPRDRTTGEAEGVTCKRCRHALQLDAEPWGACAYCGGATRTPRGEELRKCRACGRRQPVGHGTPCEGCEYCSPEERAEGDAWRAYDGPDQGDLFRRSKQGRLL